MTNLSIKLFIVFLFSLLFINLSAQKIQCHLKGEVIDRPESTMLYLTKKGGDARVSKIEIPIVDNHFDYLLECDYEEAYELSFQDEIERGSWRPTTFIAEDGEVHCKLYPMDRFGENTIAGGALNSERNQFEQLKDSIFNRMFFTEAMAALDKEKRLYNPQIYTFMDIFPDSDKNTKDSIEAIVIQLQKENSYYSSEGNSLIDKSNKLEKEGILWEVEYIKNNVSLISYTGLLDYIRMAKQLEAMEKEGRLEGAEHLSFLKLEPLFDIFKEKYKKQYPKHPYTEQMENAYRVFSQIKIGQKFIDFEAPSFDGKITKLSEQIDGKIALIDLWASWCGPCRRNSKQIIPIYEAYKEKGFTVVGVAREEKPEYGINAAKQDGYPWLNLLEVNDKNKIWEKYGVGNAGGATFLIDKNGSILAISPTPEEVEEILKKEL